MVAPVICLLPEPVLIYLLHDMLAHCTGHVTAPISVGDYDDSLCAWRKYPETQVIYHTPGLCFFYFPQQIDRQYNVRVQSSDRRILSQIISVFGLYSCWDVLCSCFKGPLSNIWLHRLVLFFFSPQLHPNMIPAQKLVVANIFGNNDRLRHYFYRHGNYS